MHSSTGFEGDEWWRVGQVGPIDEHESTMPASFPAV